ncbi:hypothetical protein F-VV10_0334 [Faustovirus]|nr:hypothetical protein F-VV10_0334 [Faustovirus]
MNTTVKINQFAEIETARLILVMAQSPENTKLITLLNFMERSYMTHDYCVKSVVTEIMKSLSLSDMLKLKHRYSNWIKEHHITYAAVLNGRADMLIYYDAYVEKQTLVSPAIKSGDVIMLTKVFTDAMNMFELMVTENSLPKEKINIKKLIWSWIDSSVASGNYQALKVMLPRVKSIVAGVGADRITRFLKKTPVDLIKSTVQVIKENDVDLDAEPANYLHCACVYGFDDVIESFNNLLGSVNPITIGMSANITLLDRYLALLNNDTDAVILPNGNVMQLSVSIIGGALETPHQDKMIEFLTYALDKFEVAPSDVTTSVYENISYENMIKLVNLGINIVFDIKLRDVDARFAYLVQNGIATDKIIDIMAAQNANPVNPTNLANQVVLSDAFVRAMLSKDKNMLTLVLGYIINCPRITLELTTATLLTILNQCPMSIAVIRALIDINRLNINDNLWGTYIYDSLNADECRFNALINKSYEKYVINAIELWRKYGVFVDTEGFIWVALVSDFGYFGKDKSLITAHIGELIKAKPEILLKHHTFDFIFQIRDYKYQSFMHYVNIDVLTSVLQNNPYVNYKFALKLAVENPEAFKKVFDLLPQSWHRDMFIVGGCLLRTATFGVIFKCLQAAGRLPGVEAIQRAITQFASHGKDDTIKIIIDCSAAPINVAPHDIALLAMRDRTINLPCLIRTLDDKANTAFSIAYLIGAYRRHPETIMKLNANGVKYQKLSIAGILAEKINDADYVDPEIENKMKAYNKIISDIAQKTKLYESLHNTVMTTMRNKKKF